MIILLLTTIIAFSLFAIIYKTKNKEGNKWKQKDGQTTVIRKEIAINITIPKEISEEEVNQIKKHEKRMEIRSNRMERHGRIWSVLFFLSSYNDCTKEYYTKRELRYYRASLDEVWKRKPSKEDIETAIRFCQIEHKRRKCDHEITDEEKKHIHDIRQYIKNELKRSQKFPEGTFLPPSSLS